MIEKLGPAAAARIWPYKGHRNMAQVIRQEGAMQRCADEFELTENPEICERLTRTAMFRSNTRFVSALLTYLDGRP
jgi:hypothetical protein